MARALRVYIVDDSASARLGLRRMLAAGGVEVVGEASDGRRALDEIPQRRPDLVLMDVLMLGINGIETTRQLMQRHPLPIVLVSDAAGTIGRLNFEGLAAGAVDLMRKPSARELSDPSKIKAWARRLRSLATVPVVTRRDSSGRGSGSAPSDRAPKTVSLVALGASTGGPRAIERLMRELPRPPWPVLVVQHIAPGFQPSMCAWLRSSTQAQVVTAGAGEVPEPGRYYFAPDGHHLSWSRACLGVSPRRGEGPCPSVDALFSSLARAAIGPRTASALLTGMGEDGAAGLLALRNAGGWTIAEAEASCVIHGMSRIAVERGAACEVLELDGIIRRLAGLGYRIA